MSIENLSNILLFISSTYPLVAGSEEEVGVGRFSKKYFKILFTNPILCVIMYIQTKEILKVKGESEMELTNIQKTMVKLAESYTKKIEDPIEEKVLYGQTMTFKTKSGRWFKINISENRVNNSNPYIYLNEVVNGKNKRIPKSEW